MVARKIRLPYRLVEPAELFRGTGRVLRFVEDMDVGSTNGWPAREIIAALDARFGLEPIEAGAGGARVSRSENA